MTEQERLAELVRRLKKVSGQFAGLLHRKDEHGAVLSLPLKHGDGVVGVGCQAVDFDGGVCELGGASGHRSVFFLLKDFGDRTVAQSGGIGDLAKGCPRLSHRLDRFIPSTESRTKLLCPVGHCRSGVSVGLHPHTVYQVDSSVNLVDAHFRLEPAP